MNHVWQLGDGLEAREETKETLWPFIKRAFAASMDQGEILECWGFEEGSIAA
jgi:hypothetical protein